MGWITALLASGPAREALGLMLIALTIAMLWLTGCAMGGSDIAAPCPPVVDYTAAD